MAAGSRFNFLRACRHYEKHFPCHKRSLSGNGDDAFRNCVERDARLSSSLPDRRATLAHTRSSVALDFEQVSARAHDAHRLARTRNATAFAHARTPKLAV